MAHPIIAAVAASATPANATSHVCTLPSGIEADDLLIAVVVCDGDAAITWPAGWTAITNGAGASGTAVRSEARYRIADGGEGASITLTGGSEAWVSRTWRITGHNNTAPECAAATGVWGNPNPLPLTVSWGYKDTLWLCHVGWDTRPAFTFWPGFVGGPWYPRLAAHVNESGAGAGDVKQASFGVHASGPRLNLTAFTSEAAAWRALMIAIEPATGPDPRIAERLAKYGVEA
jgi:hypothetical protein